MPLMMLSLPLAVLPMSPGVELNLGNSLIPLTGMVLLLKTLVGRRLWPGPAIPAGRAGRHVRRPAGWPSAGRSSSSTANRCSSARASGLSLGLWLQAPACATAGRCPRPPEGIVLWRSDPGARLRFPFVGTAAAGRLRRLRAVTLALQLAASSRPRWLMAVVLTRSPRQTLLLKLPRWKMIPAAAVLAVALHPFIMRCSDSLVMSGSIRFAPRCAGPARRMQSMFASANLGTLVLLRGRPAGGLRGAGLPRLHPFRLPQPGQERPGDCRQRALLRPRAWHLAAVDQRLRIGLVLGYLAVRSGSLLPGVVFHFLHNAMAVLTRRSRRN